MDSTGSSEGQQPAWTGLPRTKKGALGRLWEKVDAGTVEVNGTTAARAVGLGHHGPDLQRHVVPQQLPSPTSPHLPTTTYGRRVLPPRQTSPTTPTTPTTPTPSPLIPQQTDYIPHPIRPSEWNGILRTASQTRDPRTVSSQPHAVPLDDDAFMMNISPLFTNGSFGMPGQPDRDQRNGAEVGSPSQHPPAVSPSISIPSIDRPSPTSQPYPCVPPPGQNVRGERSVGDASGVTQEDRRITIIPKHPNHFLPAKIGIDIGFDCITKHWVPGWTTISRCEQWAKDQWFEEFKALAKWEADDTPEIKRIFFEKCRKKLNNGWYNLRHERSAEGIRFLKRTDVEAGLLWYLRHAAVIYVISERNKKNSQGTEGRCVHRGGPKATHLHYNELAKEGVVSCLDMYDRLKKKPDGTYLGDKGEEKALKLKRALDDVKGNYGGGPIPQAVDFDIGSKVLGINKRTKLPNVIGTAATMVEGSQFHTLGSHRTVSSHPSTSSQLEAVVQQMSQLQQQQQTMTQHLQQQQQIIMNLTQALQNATNFQPQQREAEDDMQSTD